jgi:NADPH:quinone reductase-like Zn-dependent oxidoreductase
MSKNTTQIKAAVVREKGGPFDVETLTLEGPRRDEVLVRIVATGLCRTDMVARDKGYPVPHPIVLGHDGAGIVESVGADVVKVAPGDSVVLTFLTCYWWRSRLFARGLRGPQSVASGVRSTRISRHVRHRRSRATRAQE